MISSNNIKLTGFSNNNQLINFLGHVFQWCLFLIQYIPFKMMSNKLILRLNELVACDKQ